MNGTTHPILRAMTVAALAIGLTLAPGAWTEPASQAPLKPVVDGDSALDELERAVFGVLTPEQRQAFADGADPASLVLASGETLADFIGRQLEKGLVASGLVYFPLPRCHVLQTWASTEGKMAAGETRDFIVRGETTDLSDQGGSASGCGVPVAAESLAVNFRVSDHGDSTGQLRVWATGQSAGYALIHYTAGSGLIYDNATVLDLCLAAACASDFRVWTRNAAAHVSMDVLGYFAPGPGGPSGPSGPSGPGGPSGPSGPGGPSGPSGPGGPSGPSGPGGPSGPSGPSGSSGPGGPSGPSGPSGPGGPGGPSGPSGPDGPSGPSGPGGPSGPSGPGGPSGPSGPSGPGGPSGPSGPGGPSGPSGPAGPGGPSGPSGPGGPSGPSGPQGPPGNPASVPPATNATGGNQAHGNMQPYLAINFIIAVTPQPSGFPYPSPGGSPINGPVLGEIKMFGGNFAPEGWEFCRGQLLPIASNTALFSLLGTMYGGNGETNFALPDLRGRVPLSFGSGPGLPSYAIGQKSGQHVETLEINKIPSHTHTIEEPD